MLVLQTQADLFFVDWERPRSSERGGEEGTVSVWRTIFVANEWAELQVRTGTHRPDDWRSGPTDPSDRALRCAVWNEVSS